ncbi:hypothetical protein J7K27_05295 [Candidatus Bathyarchaeota archaeon]|nr:hypothetical protein [Candidatus Bathyarchaeota archaeon]
MEKTVKVLPFKCPYCGKSILIDVKLYETDSQTETVTITAKDVEEVLPDQYVKLLTIKEHESSIWLIPECYLGKEKFKEILGYVKEKLGGRYVSKGKESYFEIPKRQRVEAARQATT